MKANELRIGNLVNGVLTQKPYIIDAWALREMESGNYQNSQDTETKVFEPIPLTREWLIKFKFEGLEKDCRTFFKKGKFKVELTNGGNVYYNRNIFISSVHQLQNLYFALTGEELTFKSE